MPSLFFLPPGVVTGTLARLARGPGKVFASLTTWYQLVRRYQWRQPRTVRTLEKQIGFYVNEHNARLPHSAFQGQAPDEMCPGTRSHIPEMLEAAREAARQSRGDENRKKTCPNREPLTVIPQ
jgi:hypothetical protein